MPLPKILNTGFKIDEPKLWAIKIPVTEIPLPDLKNNLNIPYLEKEGTDDWNLTPKMLLQNLAKEIHHAKKVEESDLKHPIEIYFHKNQWIILDGVHRFTKAHLLKNPTIKVRKVPPAIIQKVKR